MKKVRFVWGTPGWGWRMYGLLCLESKKMWFFGLSRQNPNHRRRRMMVQRYRPDELEMIGMHPESDGDYVDYEDYAALEQRIQELAAEITEPSIKELDVLYRIRKAVGDDGRMTQDDLVRHVEGLVGRVKELKGADR